MPTRLASWPDLAAAERELLGEVGALELLARLAQRQRQQVLLHQRLLRARRRRQFLLHLGEADFLGPAGGEQPLHEARRAPADCRARGNCAAGSGRRS